MARLMSQVKGGYYAAAPEAVAAVMERLRPPVDGECVILDPCAGEGKALLQLAAGLKAMPYGIELSEDRAAIMGESLPGGQALAPADFFRCAISYRSFSFIWCNPPYDYATGEEGRVESQFLGTNRSPTDGQWSSRVGLSGGCGQQLPDGGFLPGTILRHFGDALPCHGPQVQ